MRRSNFLHGASIILPSTGLMRTILHPASLREMLVFVFGTGALDLD